MSQENIEFLMLHIDTNFTVNQAKAIFWEIFS